MQPKYLNTLYLYFPLNTLIYLNKRPFSLLLKMPPSIEIARGGKSLFPISSASRRFPRHSHSSQVMYKF